MVTQIRLQDPKPVGTAVIKHKAVRKLRLVTQKLTFLLSYVKLTLIQMLQTHISDLLARKRSATLS